MPAAGHARPKPTPMADGAGALERAGVSCGSGRSTPESGSDEGDDEGDAPAHGGASWTFSVTPPAAPVALPTIRVTPPQEGGVGASGRCDAADVGTRLSMIEALAQVLECDDSAVEAAVARLAAGTGLRGAGPSPPATPLTSSGEDSEVASTASEPLDWNSDDEPPQDQVGDEQACSRGGEVRKTILRVGQGLQCPGQHDVVHVRYQALGPGAAGGAAALAALQAGEAGRNGRAPPEELEVAMGEGRLPLGVELAVKCMRLGEAAEASAPAAFAAFASPVSGRGRAGRVPAALGKVSRRLRFLPAAPRDIASQAAADAQRATRGGAPGADEPGTGGGGAPPQAAPAAFRALVELLRIDAVEVLTEGDFVVFSAARRLGGAEGPPSRYELVLGEAEPPFPGACVEEARFPLPASEPPEPVLVTSLEPGGLAERSGVRLGDLLTAVEGRSTADMSREDAAGRAPRPTPVPPPGGPVERRRKCGSFAEWARDLPAAVREHLEGAGFATLALVADGVAPEPLPGRRVLRVEARVQCMRRRLKELNRLRNRGVDDALLPSLHLWGKCEQLRRANRGLEPLLPNRVQSEAVASKRRIGVALAIHRRTARNSLRQLEAWCYVAENLLLLPGWVQDVRRVEAFHGSSGPACAAA
ncbi:unnamed protein product [Prorocentrum cordatum]|uniref:PDZ domain-containing protein n=1 Tax=Prorocentrum cordatum TaxID=2364126 RepID=A0ABN9WHN2_9DINO|nr:unnamed protein product [Polarella glacialis]